MLGAFTDLFNKYYVIAIIIVTLFIYPKQESRFLIGEKKSRLGFMKSFCMKKFLY